MIHLNFTYFLQVNLPNLYVYRNESSPPVINRRGLKLTSVKKSTDMIKGRAYVSSRFRFRNLFELIH